MIFLTLLVALSYLFNMQNLQGIKELVFSKGMNNRDKPEFLKEGQCVLAQNCMLGDEEIVKGPGTTTLFNIGNGKPCLGGIATSTFVYNVFNFSDDSMAQLYYYTGSGNPVGVGGGGFSQGYDCNFVDTGTGIYVLNGIDAVAKVVGTTISRPAGIPIGKYACWLNNRLYIAGNSTYPSRLYYSDADDPDTFGVNSYIDVSPSDRSPITGLSSLGGLLVIGKRDNIITFSGFTEDDFTVKKLTETLPNYGVTSHRSMINTGDDLYFMSFAGSIPHIRSLMRTSEDKLNYGGTISEAIEGTMEDVNKNALDQVAGGFDGRYCYWSLPSVTSATNDYTIMYDTYNKGWTVHNAGIEANCFFRSTITGDDRLYFGSSRNYSKVYALTTTVSSREDASYTFEFKTRVYRPQVSRKCKFKYLYLVTGASTDTTLSIYASPDGYSEELQREINPKVSNGVFPVTFPFYFGQSTDKRHRINLRLGVSRTIQFIFKEDSSATTIPVFPLTFPITFGIDNKVVIKEWDLLFYARNLRST